MAGVCTNAVVIFKLANIKDNLKDQIQAGNSQRIIHTAVGEYFCGRDFSLVVLNFSR